MQKKTHFGFQSVDIEEKAGMVKGVFNSVASRYDIMNDAMSLGVHRLWKDAFVSWLNPQDGMSIVDVAGGTGDIAFRIRDKANCNINICDINHAMLVEGKKRAYDKNILSGLDWLCGDAEHLPLPDASQDAYTIAFGIRNVTTIENALKEAYRVLKPGGRFMCLEFSRVEPDILRKIYDLYSFALIPRMGKLLTGDSESYQYLVESIRQFPDQRSFSAMIAEQGFSNVKYRNMSEGVVAIHSGRRL